MSRYHRQTLLPHWGPDGQARLAEARIAIVGIGALGCASADLLARAGVGNITLIDRDLVELTNIQRQVLFTEQDAKEALPKAQAAKQRLTAINSSINITAHIADLTSANIERLIDPRTQVIIDGTDNFSTRYLLNDLAVQRGIPLCYGGVLATHGMQATFLCNSADFPCLRCIFEDPPPPGTTPTCDTAGVLGPAVSIVAASQAADVIKILLGKQDLLSHALLEFDLWSNIRHQIDLRPLKRTDCPCCGTKNFEFLHAPPQQTATLCGKLAVQIPGTSSRISFDDLARQVASIGAVTHNPFFIRLSPHTRPPGFDEDCQMTIFTDGRTIIHGTNKPELARAAYARFIGS